MRTQIDGVMPSILQAIGNTPLVALDRLAAKLPGRILLKLEYFNPGFSIKDRIALKIVEDAERAGTLRPGGTVIELTSGNTGTGLAIVCAVKGYPLIAVMSEGNSIERRRMLVALGARVELVPQTRGARPGQVSKEDLDLVDQRTEELTRQLGAFRADQFHNASNVDAHELTTGAEIWEQTGGEVSVFVGTVGTAGTFMGVARALKKRRPETRTFAVEPATASILAGEPIVDTRHKIQGAGYALIPPLWDAAFCDGFVGITDDEAIDTARRLAREEAVFAGFSTGANVAAALRLAREAKPGTLIVTTANDSGLKYLSTDLFLA
ncbi:MAG TPA: cysteine synthase family protein [Chloroflexota bacterium]|nr:cysteine synthase family protein [Chloroflexota bacterium]